MSVKRFHSRRSNRSLLFWGSLGAVLLLLGLLAMDITGSDALMIVASGLVLLCIVAAVVKSKRETIEYVLSTESLLLRRGVEEQQLFLRDVLDANPVDLVTAKHHVRQHLDALLGSTGSASEDARRMLTRYCGVPLSGIAAFNTGLSRLSVQNFRRTLVLLRTRDGGTVILSPRYSESMVSAIGKALDVSREEGQAGTGSANAQVLPHAKGAT